LPTEDLKQRIKLLENEIRIMKSNITSIESDTENQRKRIKENLDKIKLNKQLPYLVGNVVEVLDMDDEEEEEDGGAADIDSQRKVGPPFIMIVFRGLYSQRPCLSHDVRMLAGEECRHQNFHAADHLFADSRACGCGRTQARRLGGDKQGQLSDS